jgi:hypothetical protein
LRVEKVFIDSAFYDDPEHKYPTVEEQIALARRVAQSVLLPTNASSRGYKMFVKRRERSIRWEAGYKPGEGDEQPPAEDDVNKPTSPTSLTTTTPLTLTSFVFAPKLPTGETMVDPEKLDALSSEELERVMLFEKKTTHTNVAPQVRLTIVRRDAVNGCGVVWSEQQCSVIESRPGKEVAKSARLRPRRTRLGGGGTPPCVSLISVLVLR